MRVSLIQLAVTDEEAPTERRRRAVDLVAAPSRAMLGSLVANYGSDLPPSRVILNGRNAARFQPASKEPFIFAAGRIWDEGKNIAAIASVASSLSWPVYIAGDNRSPNAKLTIQ